VLFVVTLITVLAVEGQLTFSNGWGKKRTITDEPVPAPATECVLEHAKVLTQAQEMLTRGLEKFIECEKGVSKR